MVQDSGIAASIALTAGILDIAALAVAEVVVVGTAAAFANSGCIAAAAGRIAGDCRTLSPEPLLATLIVQYSSDMMVAAACSVESDFETAG